MGELAGLTNQVAALQAEIDSRDEKMSGLEAAAEQANKGEQQQRRALDERGAGFYNSGRPVLCAVGTCAVYRVGTAAACSVPRCAHSSPGMLTHASLVAIHTPDRPRVGIGPPA